jgi:hypothetical protein
MRGPACRPARPPAATGTRLARDLARRANEAARPSGPGSAAKPDSIGGMPFLQQAATHGYGAAPAVAIATARASSAVP